jgi:3-phosphoinositide dependent protein kinase-1
MGLDLIRYYMAELLSALEIMHNRNIVHRDLKPENILIAEDWHLKIVSYDDHIMTCYKD